MEPTGKTSEEVEVPKLAENGQNWKIYRAKIIEAAAMDITDPMGVLAGLQPDDGSYDWECLDAILKWTFYTSVPITILRPIQKLNTTHEIFNYLAKRFCDNNPITDPHTMKSEPSTNKVDGAGTATAAETPENCPMSADAAIEQHVRAEWDEDDHQDLHTGLEASAQGTSAKCIETTAVVLKSTLHEMQNQSQYSLLLTPRPPIEGEPSGYKQEVADSVMMAERTNGTVKLAKPNESDADVNGKATLGSEPVAATVACGVDEGAKTECDGESQLQQTYFYCEKDCQCNGNTYLLHTDCCLRGSGLYIQAARRATPEATQKRSMQLLSMWMVWASPLRPQIPRKSSRRTAAEVWTSECALTRRAAMQAVELDLQTC